MTRLVVLCTCLTVPLLGCNDDSNGAGDDAEDGGTGGTGGNDDPDETGADSAGETSDGDGGTTGTTDAGEPEGPVFARGLTIASVSVNQGVEVPVWVDGNWVDGPSRNAKIAQNRQTLLRATWAFDEATWEPREIEAVLTLTLPDGSEEVAPQKLLVDNISFPGDINRTFHWMLPAELVVTGLKFQITLYEVDDSHASMPEPDPPPVYPAEADWIGVEDSYMVLRATLIPVEHDTGAGNCAPAPNIDENVVKVFTEQFHMQNPVELVEITVREPTTFSGDLTGGFSPLLNHLASLRGTDGADAGEYYYGMVTTCDGGPDNVGGTAIDIPGLPTMGNGWSRTSVGRWYGTNANTFIHEVGHTQGRRHVACNGEEGGPDPRYPYENGQIGVWGFGILDWSMHSPTASNDFMTYCGQTWVSDWGWQEMWPYVEIISSWDMGGKPPQPGGQLLLGAIEPDGDEHWAVVPGRLDDRSPTPGHAVELIIEGQRVAVPAAISVRPHDGTRNVVIELPTEMSHVGDITRVSAGQRFPVDRSAIVTPQTHRHSR